MLPYTDAEKTDLAAVADALRAARFPLLTTHVAPDGDGIGSALILKRGLERQGIPCRIGVRGPLPRILDFLYEPGEILVHPSTLTDDQIREHDCVVLLDASDLKRAGEIREALTPRARRVVIDHHVASDEDPDPRETAFRCTRATATAEVVIDLLETHFDQPLDRALALPLYTALMTETGSFKFSNTTGRCLRMAARCVETGIEPDMVSGNLYMRQEETSLRLLGRALTKIERDETGRLAWIALGLDDFTETGATHLDTFGLVGYPRSLDGVELAILMFEDEPEFVKISFRSKREIDVSRIAAEFGGGGHVRAAGAALRLPLAQAQKTVIDRARQLVAADPGL